MDLAEFEMEGLIGRGGAGVVLRARSRDGRAVAVKLLRSRALHLATMRARFEREARLLAALGERDGFVPLLGTGEDPKHGPFIVMPFVGGGTLADRLKRGLLPIPEVLALGRTLAAALDRAHSLGIVHRDLKPANILFTEDGRPLLADLGIAKHFDPEPGRGSISLSVTGEFRGTFGYMAPEQMADSKSAGPAADVFSLGAILYECLAGRPPFDASPLEALHAPLVPVARLRPDSPPWLNSIVERCLEKEPSLRYGDASALARALGGFAEERRSRRAILLVLAVVVAALSVVAWALAPRSREKKTVPPVVAPPPAPPVKKEVEPPAPFTRWITKASMPVGIMKGSAVAVSGRIHVLGGREQIGAQTLHMEYDPATDTWRRLRNMGRARLWPGAAEIGGKLYVAGGFDGSETETVDSTEVYDPETDTWTELAPSPRTTWCVAFHGKLWSVGGWDGHHWTSSVEVYDPSTDLWESREALSGVPSVDFQGVVSTEKAIAVLKALTPSFIALGSPAEGSSLRFSSTEVPDLPAHSAVAVLGDRAYIIGGERAVTDKAWETLGTVTSYDLAGAVPGDRREEPQLEYPRRSLMAAVVGGKLYAMGGLRGRENHAIDVVEELGR